MSTLDIPNRPFSTEQITGLAMPDGIFESTLGVQKINIHLKNLGAVAVSAAAVYIESTSHPGISVTPTTRNIPGLAGNSSTLMSWQADFSLAPPGVHRISFVADVGGQKTRIIKKIFVTRVTFDPTTATFTAQTPEGTIHATFGPFLGPRGACCCDHEHTARKASADRSFLDWLRSSAVKDPNFKFCLKHYLPTTLEANLTPTQPYAGKYGDLPFQDPWWKVLLAIIAALLVIAAAIAEAIDGTGDITPSGGGTFDETTGDVDCCGVQAQGSGTSAVAAGLMAAAATVATIAAASDVRDPFRRGQDNTPPGDSEMTIAEKLVFAINYLEPVALGRPFAIGAKWTYSRITTGKTYTFSAKDTQVNQHVLSKVEIDAPDVVYRYQRIPWIIRAKFFDGNEELLCGDDLIVQCFLVGPKGQRRTILLQDDGNWIDEKPNDGTYTGFEAFFLEQHYDSPGLWVYYVIAQDVNRAQPAMTPEEAAQHIGGIVVTHNLVINFEGGTCPFVPDGHILVV